LFTSLIPEKTEYTGAMVAVGLSAEAVTNLLEKIGNTTHSFAGSLRVSCINSPINCTVSGDVQLIRLLEEMLKRESIFCRRLRVPVAYHSPQMELIVSDCLRHFEGLSPGKSSGDIAMISSVTGALLNPRDACNPGYWVSNMVSPVLFLQAMNHLCQDSGQLMRNKLDGSHHDRINVDHILEIGPHSALRSPIQETLRTMTREKEIPYFSALRQNHSATSTLLQLLGELHCRGTAVNLRRINDPDPYFDTSRVALVHAPRYPFDHSTKYWSESPIVRNYRLRAHGHVELLGSPSRDWNPMAPEWRCWVCPADILWLLDHKINGKAIYPAAAMLVMAMQGASQLMKPNSNLEGFTFRHVNLKSPIVIAPDSTNVETRLQLMPLRSESTVRERTWSFTVYSVVEGHWNENCDGTITAHWNTAKSSRADMEPSLHYRNSFSTMSSQCTDFIDHQTIYRNLNNRGHQYGKAFQGILGAYHDRKAIVIADVTAQTQLDRGASHGPFMPHTTTIDAFMQVALVSSGLSGTDIPTQAITHIDKLWVACQNVQPSFDKFQVLAKSEAATPRTRTYSGFATGPDDMVTLILDGLQTTVVSNDDSLDTTAVKRRSWYTIWTAVDVDMLSGRDISNWLDSICGPDPDGPQNFCRMLRSYLYSKSSSLHQHMETSGRPSKPHFAKYADWIEWHVNQPQHYPPTEDEFALASQLSHEGSVGKFFVTISENALDVLEGRQDMVQLLFKDNLAETFYEQQLSGSLYYQKLQTYLEAFSFKHPNMDFLEIGAGTGSFTRRILEAIQPSSQDDTARLNSYYFTDVSPAFFDRAQETFSGVAGKMKFAVLDADQDPLAQGFCEHTFDVIAASNVLHVTRNLNTTLRRLRSLLKPGGKLLLHEYVRPERIEVGFVFGLLPGWWPSAEDGRHRSPLQTEEMWDTLLRHNGFSGLDFILPDFQDEESHMMSIMCATAVHSDPPEFLPRVVIAIETNSTLQRSIAEALQARLGLGGCDQVAIVELATATVSPVAFEALVTLFDLETPLLSRMDETGFESLKALLLSAPKTLWVSNGSNSNSDPGYGMVDGFAKVFRLENINATMATLALAFNSTCEENSMAFIESALQQLLLAEGLDQPEDYIVRDGRLHVRRIQEDTTFGDKMTRNLSGIDWQTKTVQTARPFVVSSENVFPRQALRIFESPLADSDLNPGEVELEIHAVGLNEVDEFLMCGKAFGLDIGRECAGVVTRVGSDCMFTPGDRVCAYGTNMLRSIGRSKQDMIARIPQHLPFDEASTLPQDYLVAGHIVRELRLRHDDFLVICGGHTRLGIATLHTLEVMDVSLFAMVTTEQEGALLTAEIPRIVCFDTRRSNTRFKEVFPSIPTMVLDFVNTNLVELAQYLPSSGQIFSVKVGTDGSSNPLKSISIPDTVSYRVLNIMQILQNASIGLQIPHCVLEPAFEKKALTRSKVQTLKLSELGTLSEVFKGLHADQRPSIRYEAEDEINVRIMGHAPNSTLSSIGLPAYGINVSPQQSPQLLDRGWLR
jgi:NADPH:quinone reductase-like Zn-dependent oxidoreductase/SAM-dependent methyltransferase